MPAPITENTEQPRDVRRPRRPQASRCSALVGVADLNWDGWPMDLANRTQAAILAHEAGLPEG